MSQEERLLILQMVADKKLSATEAAELLRAIDSNDREQPAPAMAAPKPMTGNPTISGNARNMPPMPPTPPTPPTAPTPPSPPSLSGLGSFIENVVERVTSVLSDVVEPRYKFVSELAGDFAAGEVPLRISTGNGRISISSWDEPGFKATIMVEAGGASEEEARRRANGAYTVKAGENGFELETRRWEWSENTAVHVDLLVPKDHTYRLEGRSGNGRIEVKGVALTDNRVTSGNGRIVLEDVTADHLHVRTGNGAMEITADIADLDANSGNGSVTISPTGSRSQFLKVSTGNGSVRVNCDRISPEAGLKLDLNTGMGGVAVSHPNLVYDRDSRTMPSKHILAHTPNFDQAATQVVITARTGMGSVSVE